MEDELEQRIARNETILRQVNEAIEGGRWPGEDDKSVAFRCECGLLGCARLIEISIAEYERIRAQPRWFSRRRITSCRQPRRSSSGTPDTW